MPIAPLPALDRTSPQFKNDLDGFFLTQLPATVDSFNAEILRLNGLGFGSYTATSSTSLALGAGAKLLAIETGKGFVIGQPVLLASTANPATHYLHGSVTAYNPATGALEIDATVSAGGGTSASWSVIVTAVQSPYVPVTGLLGDVLATLRDLSAPDWLPLSGGLYLQASYPDLYGRIGTAQDLFPGTKLANLATLPGASRCIDFTPDSAYMAVGGDASPYVNIYKRSSDTFAKLSNPATLPSASVRSCAFAPNKTYLAVGSQASDWLAVYKRSGDTFTKLSAPTPALFYAVDSLAFDASSTYLAASTGSPALSVYKRSGDSFARLSSPAQQPTSTPAAVAFSPSGSYLACVGTGTDTLPYLLLYRRDADTFIKLAAPASQPSSQPVCVTFSPDGNYVIVGQAVTPSLSIYRRSGDVLTKLADPASEPDGWVAGVSFSPDGSILALALTASSGGNLYKFDSGALTQLASPVGIHAGGSNAVRFSTDSRYMAFVGPSTPFVTNYKMVSYDSSTMFKLPSYPGAGKLTNYIKASIT